MTDEQIVEGCIKKDAIAQKHLYEKFVRKMMGVCLRYADSTEEAEDVVQNGFISVFENIYSTFNGDKRACESDYYQFFDKRAVPFPSNEQMVFDSGEDLKANLKNIITRNRFRK